MPFLSWSQTADEISSNMSDSSKQLTPQIYLQVWFWYSPTVNKNEAYKGRKYHLSTEVFTDLAFLLKVFYLGCVISSIQDLSFRFLFLAVFYKTRKTEYSCM